MKKISTLFGVGLTFAASMLCLSATAAVNYVADPEPAVKVSELSKVVLTFPDVSEADKGSQSSNVTITSTDFSRGCTLEYGDDANQMVVSFAKITAEGEYTINFPADAITADSTPLEAFSITYTVGEDVVDNSTLIPAPGDVEWLYNFIYYNPDVPANLSVNSYTESKPAVTSPSGVVSELTDVYDYQVGAGKYRFNLRKLAVEPGVYTITFPENYLYYQDASYQNVYLPACEFKYNVTGGTLTTVQSNPSVANPTVNFNSLTLTFPGYDTIKIKEMSYAEKNVAVYMEGVATQMCQVPVEAGMYGFTVEGNSMIYKNLYSDYTTPGHCYMTFPEGSILLGDDETPCTPFVVEFDTVAPQPVKIDMTPADNANVSMLYDAVISFPEIAKVELGRNPTVNLELVTTVEGEESVRSVGGAYSQSYFERISDNSFRAIFNGIATESGDYRITVKSNSFTFDGGFNQDYSVDVKFTAPQAPEYAMTPSNDEALAKIQKFEISFPGQDVVKFNSKLSSNETKLYVGDKLEYNEYGITNSKVSSTTTYSAVEGSTNTFSFSLSTAALDKGKYLLVIPAGLFLMGETPDNFNGEIQLVYECNGEGIDKVKVTPSEPVRSLQLMTVEYVDQTEIFKQNDYIGFSLTMDDGAYGKYLEYISGENVYIQGNTLYLDASKPYTEAGKYYVDITAYSLFMSDGITPSTPQRIYFEVDPNSDNSAVETVVADVEDTRIYTITGTQVKDMTVPGIYVKNGRKYIVR